MNPPSFYEEITAAVPRDKYKEYIRMAPVPCEKLLEWWETRRAEYPHFLRMAFDLLFMPLMSAECERVFSAVKKFVTNKKNRFKEDILETIICLRALYKVDMVREKEVSETRRRF
jgi:hypothetical protein